MADFILGMNAKLYYGAADAVLNTMTEVTNVKDVTLNMECGEADITTRANSGWKATAPTLRDATLEFAMQWKDSDAAFTAIKNAFLANSTLALAVLTGASSAAGSEGPKANWSITKFSRDESLENAIMVNVTAKISAFDEWVAVAAS